MFDMSHDAHDEHGGHDDHAAEHGHEIHHAAPDSHEIHGDNAVGHQVGMFRNAYNYVVNPWKSRLVGAAAFAAAPPFGIVSPFIGAAAAPYIVRKGNDWWDWIRNTYSFGGTKAAAHH